MFPGLRKSFSIHSPAPPFFIAALKLILTPENWKLQKVSGKELFGPRKFLFFFVVMCIGMDETHNKNRIKHKDPWWWPVEGVVVVVVVAEPRETSILTNKFLSRRLQENYTRLGCSLGQVAGPRVEIAVEADGELWEPRGGIYILPLYYSKVGREHIHMGKYYMYFAIISARKVKKSLYTYSIALSNF